VTQVRSGDLRIYRLNQSVWVCSTRYGHRIRLAAHTTRVDLYTRPNVTTFAYAIAGGGPTGIFGSRNLKTGVLVRGHTVPATYTSVISDRLVARSDGSIAYIYSWIGSNTHDAGNAGFKALDSDCVLCGNQIDTSFLRIVGNTVEWKDNSMVRSAPFA
jgi:hypothetical protein